jgi:hypothetical protein
MVDEEPSDAGWVNFSAPEGTRSRYVFVSSTIPYLLSMYQLTNS